MCAGCFVHVAGSDGAERMAETGAKLTVYGGSETVTAGCPRRTESGQRTRVVMIDRDGRKKRTLAPTDQSASRSRDVSPGKIPSVQKTSCRAARLPRLCQQTLVGDDSVGDGGQRGEGVADVPG